MTFFSVTVTFSSDTQIAYQVVLHRPIKIKMSAEMKMEKKPKEGQEAGVVALAEKDAASGKQRRSSNSNLPSRHAASSYKEPAKEKVTSYQQPTSCYSYYYPGYNGAYAEVDEKGYFYAGDGSLMYYVPGYSPYAAVGVDGLCVGQQPYFPSSDYPVSYGSSWNTKSFGDVPTSVAVNPKSNASVASMRPKGSKPVKMNGTADTKASELPLDSKSSISSNFSKSTPQTQPLKPFNKVPSQLAPADIQSSRAVKGCYPYGEFSSFPNNGQGYFSQYGHMNYRTNGQNWAGNDRFKLRENLGRKNEFQTSTELNRGPRSLIGNAALKPSVEKDELGLSVQKDHYNLKDFQTRYENAKFFVIKSYSEDNVHKSIKHNVWSSTVNGHAKLNTAFREAETIIDDKSSKCPVFLFFSVNGSGQFVGIAEMIGSVDFNKDLDFWQQDRWNGFFPVKWHIIKDIPNGELRHILLENNDNKPVTYCRDTQEVKLKQGLEMLTIFKDFTAKTSLLDDFTFYEEQEKSLRARKISETVSPKIENPRNTPYQKQVDTGVKRTEEASIKASDPNTLLVALAKNLSINAAS
ncbi:hypothetical protein GIB67_020577 [Kingdonia uniflora]|uniref:YTH domain-containing family protein n=1 Tax=Kingdonia uniflora TaxID=39325 RepID=A0A7J7NW14_9MAGN|nr:hypothetical protein GIB67_020577 [Kingdonia uniflora]